MHVKVQFFLKEIWKKCECGCDHRKLRCGAKVRADQLLKCGCACATQQNFSQPNVWLPWIWMFENLYCSFIRIFHYFWSKLVKDTLVLRAGSEKKTNVWSGKVSQKCSTGQSFIFSEVNSYKIHTLVISLCSALYLPIFWTFSLHVVKYFDDRSPSFWICVLRTQSDSWKRHFFDWVDHCLFHWNCEIIMPSCNQI